MLDLAEIERKILQSSGALTIDPEGDETLLGLTVSESRFVLAVERTADQNVGAAESVVYRQLRQRHLASRQMFNIESRENKPESGAA